MWTMYKVVPWCVVNDSSFRPKNLTYTCEAVNVPPVFLFGVRLKENCNVIGGAGKMYEMFLFF